MEEDHGVVRGNFIVELAGEGILKLSKERIMDFRREDHGVVRVQDHGVVRIQDHGPLEGRNKNLCEIIFFSIISFAFNLGNENVEI